MGQSIWQSCKEKGYSRRDFLQFCSAAAVIAGFGKTGAARFDFRKILPLGVETATLPIATLRKR